MICLPAGQYGGGGLPDGRGWFSLTNIEHWRRRVTSAATGSYREVRTLQGA